MVAISGSLMLSQQAAACGGRGFQIFVEQQVRILPEGAIQVRLQVLEGSDGVARPAPGETQARLVQVSHGRGLGIVPGREVLVSLVMPPTSCHWVGNRAPEYFVVAHVKIEERAGKPTLVLYPVPYSQRRGLDEERETAAYFNDR